MISKTTAIIAASIIVTAAVAGAAVYIHNLSSESKTTVIDGGNGQDTQDTADYSTVKILADLVDKLDKYGGEITTRDGKPKVYVNPQDEVYACQDVIVVVKLESKTSYFFDIHNIHLLVTNK